MASGVQDITCVFVEVAWSYEKNAHRRLELFTLHYITLHYITSFFPHTVGNFFFFFLACDGASSLANYVPRAQGSFGGD